MSNQSGLSAVELLITLFIAATFLMAGYLLWGFTQQGSVQANQATIASNIAYDYARRYKVTSGTCAVTPAPVTNVAPDNSNGLPNATIKVEASCPAPLDTLSIVKIKSTVSYGNVSDPKKVTHVLYAN
jgi:hypothetical protein